MDDIRLYPDYLAFCKILFFLFFYTLFLVSLFFCFVKFVKGSPGLLYSQRRAYLCSGFLLGFPGKFSVKLVDHGRGGAAVFGDEIR